MTEVFQTHARRGELPRPDRSDAVPIDRRGLAACLQAGSLIRIKVSDLDAFIAAARIEPGTLTHLYPVRDLDDVG
jgi:hypothetical protein